jgi:PAS domain S-box-containing protein
VGKNGIVVYSNDACFPLLEIWGINTGEKLPSKIMFYVRKAILQKEVQEFEVKKGNRKYLLTLKSPGDGYVYIYEIKLRSKKIKQKLLNTETRQKISEEPGKTTHSFSDLRDLLDQIAEMIASNLKVESCIILKISHEKTGFPDNLPSEWTKEKNKKHDAFNSKLNKASTTEASFQYFKPGFEEETCNYKHIEEIGSNNRFHYIPNEFAGGISVFARRDEEFLVVITLIKVKPADFSPDKVCFLRYVLSLILRIIECQEIDKKLKDRIRFFETLLFSVPDPTYFRNISQTTEDNNENLTDRIADFSKGKTAGNPILEINKIINEEVTASCEKKSEHLLRGSAGFMEIMQDFNGLKKSEDTLKIALEVQKVLWTVINNSPAVVFLWKNEENWPADFVSENVSQFGYTVEDFISGKFLYGDIIHREDIERVRTELDQCIENGYGGFRTEYRIYTKNGELRWVDERTFIQRNRERKVSYLQGVVIDITERKIAEEAFKEAERLRKKEINHRIKNNLQIVSSLLDLQAEKFSDSKVIEAFRESKSRILSISLMHQELYESGKLDSIDFSSYIRKLAADIIRSYGTENREIKINLEISGILLGVDTAVSLGLIINELLTNSLRYAFSTGSCGEIRIALLREKDQEKKAGTEISREICSAENPDLRNSLPYSETCESLTLIFEDNGKGFPEEIDFKNPDTLGLQLVNILVEQIEGSIDLERGRGTKFIIKFKRELQFQENG